MSFRIHLSVTALLIASWGTTASGQLPSWESDNRAGYQAYKEGRYIEAQNYFLAALGRAEQFGEGDPRLITALNNLAGLYVGQGKYSAAEPLYQHALSIRKEFSGTEDTEVASILSNLGVLYIDEGRYSEAESLYKRALEIRERVREPEDTHWASLLSNFGTLYFVEAKY